MRPVNAPITQGFGGNASYYKPLGLAGHNGWDFAAPLGTAVRAPESGTAVASVDSTGYGRLITIKGKSGWTHKLAHLQRYGKVGAVSEGTVVGYVNSTGFSTGNHLHWGTRPPKFNSNNGYFGYVSPQQFLSKVKSKGGLTVSERKELERYQKEYRWLALQAYLGRPASKISSKEVRQGIGLTLSKNKEGIRESGEAKRFRKDTGRKSAILTKTELENLKKKGVI